MKCIVALTFLCFFSTTYGRSPTYCSGGHLSVCNCCSDNVWSKQLRYIELNQGNISSYNGYKYKPEVVEVEYICCGRSVYKTYGLNLSGEKYSTWNRNTKIKAVHNEVNIRRSYSQIDGFYRMMWKHPNCISNNCIGWAYTFYYGSVHATCFHPSTIFLDAQLKHVKAEEISVGSMVKTLSPDGISMTSTLVQLVQRHNATKIDYVNIHLRNIDQELSSSDETVLSVTGDHGMILLDLNGVPEPTLVKANGVIVGNRMRGVNGTILRVFNVENFSLNTTVQLVTKSGTVLANGILCTTQNLE